MSYIPVMGLEIHCELLTKTKVFCSCSNEFGGKPNTRVCPQCMGMPGALPSLNKNALHLAVKAGLALGCVINKYSAFDRKNYFYPDLPKAYQITQFYHPICANGSIELKNGRKIRINRIHIEEDAGKMVHDDVLNISMADYNRCGVPLIEIVTEPDFRSADEINDFVRKLALRLKYANVCDGRMEQGSLRVDVNISVMDENSHTPGTRAEIKNLNSLKSISKTVEYETKRQIEIISSGGKVIQETRRFDMYDEKTYSMRSKENTDDYRYFPEPDLPPVTLDDAVIESIRKDMPKMPQERYLQYTGEYSLPPDDASLIISDMDFSDFYDKAVSLYPNYRRTANLMLVELNRCLNETHTDMKNIRFSPGDLAETVKMADDGLISNNAAKEIVAVMFESGEAPMRIAQTRGFIMNSDESALSEIIESVIAKNESIVCDYKNGNEKVFGYLMGQAIRLAGKSANPQLIRKFLQQKLNGEV